MSPPRKQPDVTRQALLEAAFHEIHRHGFRATTLDDVIAAVGVTKGALYHHFRTKQALGYAVVDEMVRPLVQERWKPAIEADSIIDGAILVCERLRRDRSEIALTLGCPFNNLVNEMSPVDEGFRLRLDRILEEWREGLIASIAQGQRLGTVRQDVDPLAVAAFIIASIEGCAGLAKATRSRDFVEAGFRGLIDYLGHLQPASAAPTH